MNDANDRDFRRNDDDATTPEPVRGDRLDELLRAWHDENASSARAIRDRVLARSAEDAVASPRAAGDSRDSREFRGQSGVLARIGFRRLASLAAVLALVLTLATLFVKSSEKSAFATGGIAQVPEGGALDALDEDGVPIGPCPLQKTDVAVEISGPFARTVVEQTYANPYTRTIEAVYTFPLSERAAVDRMTMIVRGPGGERVVEGEVKERAAARAIYEDARESGYVASLLEQERPNVFTQSVANIEPGATVVIRIATIETVRRKDGVSSYVFPMVVGPRYVPGAPTSVPTLPDGWTVRQGIVLRGPARVDPKDGAAIGTARLTELLERAIPVRPTDAAVVDRMLSIGDAIAFTANYANGSAERGIWSPSTGLGEINGRFFHAPASKDGGAGFAADTDQVPDASRITPMPVPPTERAGHDISVRVAIDTGGAPLAKVESALHAITSKDDAPSRRTISLVDARTIPNRDFILEWSTAERTVEPGFFTHVATTGDAAARGGYFTLVLEPPARVAPAEIRPRELVFVLDVSGSMNGFPIEKSKALARKAIERMRANDTFNVITFAGATSVLWPEPRPATEENRRIADEFVNGAYGSGGTEMMAAINAALVQDGRSGVKPAKLLDLPADGRAVRVVAEAAAIARGASGWSIDAGGGRSVKADIAIAIPANAKGAAIILDGTWETRDADRVFVARSARFEDADARTRFVFFLTDGYIGNDQAVVQAVRDNARASRVFSFGIGNSVNRFLLEEMARAGRGACEIVTLSDDADPVIDALVRRIDAPVLTDIEVSIDGALGVRDLLPAGEHLPDLFDEEPIVLMGRFDRAASGEIVVRGRTAGGPWERRVRVDFPAEAPQHDVVKTLWARAKVDDLLLARLGEVEQGTLDARTKSEVIRLGESYAIATPFTSFVAVEKSRVTVGGKPMLVSVPVELPDGTNWNGFFGEGGFDMLPVAVRDGAVGSFVRGFAVKAEERGLIDADGAARFDTGWFASLEDGTTLGVAVDALDDPGKDRGALGAARRSPTGDALGKRGTSAPAISGGMPAAKPAGPPGAATNAATGSAVGGAAASPSASPPSAATASDPTASAPTVAAPAAAAPADASAEGRAAPPGASTRRFQFGREQAQGQRFAKEELAERDAAAARPSGRSGGFGGGGGSGGVGGAVPAQPLGGGLGGVEKGKSQRPRAAAVDSKVDELVREQAAAGESDQGASPGQRSDDAEAGEGDTADASAGGVELLTIAERDRLVQVLDRRLLVLALAALLGEDARIPAIAGELGLGDAASLEVAMKVAVDAKGAIDGAVLESLRALGVRVEDEVAARGLIVARLSPPQLVKAALVAGVRRVEPIVRPG